MRLNNILVSFRNNIIRLCLNKLKTKSVKIKLTNTFVEIV